MIKSTKNILNEFKTELAKIYGNSLKQIILYGSFARNESTENSDIDLAVVLQGEIHPGKEIDRMIDTITEINLKYNVLISIYPVSENNYYTLKSPLLMNVRNEGVPV